MNFIKIFSDAPNMSLLAVIDKRQRGFVVEDDFLQIFKDTGFSVEFKMCILRNYKIYMSSLSNLEK